MNRQAIWLASSLAIPKTRPDQVDQVCLKHRFQLAFHQGKSNMREAILQEFCIPAF